MIKLTPQQNKIINANPIKIYKEILVGNSSWLFFIVVETITFLLANLRGLIGLVLRSVFYPLLFNSCGKSLALGANGSVRGFTQISLGNKCLIDEQVVLDAKNSNSEIKIGNFVSIGRSSIIVAKNGKINIADGVNISSNCRIATDSSVVIGESSLIAAYVYIGPGNHQVDDAGQVLVEAPTEIKGGVEIGKNVWIGTRATIMDGVKIGDGAIIGAHSLVKSDVPANSVAVGIPARIIMRK